MHFSEDAASPEEATATLTVTSAVTATAIGVTPQSLGARSVSAASLEEAVLEVAKAFRLQKLLLPAPRVASDWFGRTAPTPESLLARSPALAALVQQLVDRSGPGPATPNDTASFDASTALPSTDALARKLAQPLQLSHLRLKCEREMFALVGGESAARLSGQDDDQQATLVASDVAQVSLSEPSSMSATGGAAHRVLPRAMFAQSHVEVDATLGCGSDDEGVAVTATVGALVRRVGAALLLVGRVQEAALVAAAILGRADIAAACRDVLPSPSSPSAPEHAELSHGATTQAAEQQALLRARVEAFDLAFEFFADGL